MPLNSIRSHNLQSAPRQTRAILRSGRGAGTVSAPHIQVELDSSRDKAPTCSKSIHLREIHRQIDHNEMLQRWLGHSTKLLCNARAHCHGRRKRSCTSGCSSPRPVFAPYSLIGGKSAPASALTTLGGVKPAKIMSQDYVAQGIF
jgi:hypothetical protein